MAFDDALQASLAAVYAFYGVPAVWTPGVGGPVSLPVIEDKTGDAIEALGSAGTFNMAQRRYRARTSDVDPEGVGRKLAKRDTVTIAGQSFTIQNSPRQTDDRRVEWTFELA